MEKYRCADLGGENCPCAAGISGSCIQCAKLCGRSCEECEWGGVCMYAGYIGAEQKGAGERKSVRCEVTGLVRYADDIFVITVDGGISLTQKSAVPGAFMFCRNPEKDCTYDMPLSVLKTHRSDGLISFAVWAAGPKSKSLLEAAAWGSIMVRGVYKTGLVNMNYFNPSKESVVIGRGTATTPLGNMISGTGKSLINPENMTLYIDYGKAGAAFFSDWMGEIPATAVNPVSLDEETKLIQSIAAKSAELGKNLFLLVSPYYADLIAGKLTGRIIRPNHSNMCCGEGICGACSYTDGDNKVIRLCKTYVREGEL